MQSAIAGDIIGSVREFVGTKTTQFELFPPGCFLTDDTVLTVALANSILTGGPYAANPRRCIGGTLTAATAEAFTTGR